MSADRPKKHWARRLVVRGAFVYLLTVTAMWFLENRFVYHPSTADAFWTEPPDPRIRDVWIDANIKGSERLHGWWLPLEGASEALVICHGNGGNVCTRGPSLVRFADGLKRSILIFDYPGYGKSPGSPNEEKCYESARAASRWLLAQGFASERVVIYGESLGGGVATKLAAEVDHRALILMKTFTTLPDVAKSYFPMLPTQLLMSNRFDNASRIKECKRPILIAGATADSIVPYRFAQRLFEMANEPKRFRVLEGDEHNSPLPPDFVPEMRQFLEEHP